MTVPRDQIKVGLNYGRHQSCCPWAGWMVTGWGQGWLQGTQLHIQPRSRSAAHVLKCCVKRHAVFMWRLQRGMQWSVREHDLWFLFSSPVAFFCLAAFCVIFGNQLGYLAESLPSGCDDLETKASPGEQRGQTWMWDRLVAPGLTAFRGPRGPFMGNSD